MKIGRRSLLFGALVLTLLVAVWPLPEPSPQGEESGTAARKRNAPAPAPAGKQPLTLADLSPSPAAEEPAAGDLFPRQTWTPPPTAAKDARPEPPPLPFGYGGRYTEGGKTMAFLTEGTVVHTIRQGDTLKDVYRVDEISDDSITLTYLPLGRQQKLPAPTPQR